MGLGAAQFQLNNLMGERRGQHDFVVRLQYPRLDAMGVAPYL